MKVFVTLKHGKDGWVVAECPALTGCVSQGRTKEEALANIREAIELSLETRGVEEMASQIEIVEV
ncbi:MAG: type II toxin-antitoxin system HicB family antitoxin [Candidatus Binatus sp.]|uniref:type II toxin-antitoxin system HicB family antitoxin n=1 Tax=Candidatus Binatus sp. TaxID=2811406 RepID=UPI0027237AC4|nr:type II toxin-antitoxin system HicB family antitoxin [Candidatus Binatus sp.]MDO8433489.1 type II toxin-antitoxin system HicB family antitoxin [Candidatus Binatus sp.]